MLKHFVTLIFIFAVAGQASAGVCGCFSTNNTERHTCCPRDDSYTPSISQKGCCEYNCVQSSSDFLARHRSEQANRLSFKEATEPAAVVIPVWQTEASDFRNDVTSIKYSRQYPRPPNLYLRFQSLLI
jgi:hypothetical protein